MGELNRFVDNFDADPARLQQLEERLDAIYTLARKHRIQPFELAAMQQTLLEEIETLDANDESIERLGEELQSFARHYHEKALELSQLRQQAATGLASAVELEIQRLGMPGGASPLNCAPTPATNCYPMAWSRSSYWSAPTRTTTQGLGQGSLGWRAVTHQPGDPGHYRPDIAGSNPGVRRS